MYDQPAGSRAGVKPGCHAEKEPRNGFGTTKKAIPEMGVSWVEMGGDSNRFWQVITGEGAEPKEKLNGLKRFNELNEVDGSTKLSAGFRDLPQASV
jgi:hypothetical protein